MDKFLRKFHDDIIFSHFKNYDVNSGGCAKAAVEFYKFFNKLNKYKVLGIKILTSERIKASPIKTEKKLKEEGFGNYFDHVVLAIKHDNQVYYVDAIHGIVLQSMYHEVSRYTRLKPMPGYMSFKRMQYYCNRPHTWNRTFKHSNLKHIRKFLDNYHERNLYENRIRRRTVSAPALRAPRNVKEPHVV